MSKSAGNVVTPDSVAAARGADALRIYLLFMAPFENNTTWEEADIVGAERFLQRFWRLANVVVSASEYVEVKDGSAVTRLQSTLHRTVRRVTADIEAFKFNTAVAALMECLNEMTNHYQRAGGVTTELAWAVRTLNLLLAPFAPHIAEEVWQRLGEPYSVHQQPWPKWDEAQIAAETITLVIQVNGKVRDRIHAPADVDDETARQIALNSEAVQRYLEGREPERVVVVRGRLVNIVV
jgi:leucyl-tRNA synthetase